MARNPIQKNLSDDFGNEYTYTFFPLPAGKGVKILRRLMKHLPQALSQALKGLEGADGDTTLSELEGADFDVLGAAVGHIAELIGESGDDAFFKDLFFETVRQDPETGKGAKVAQAFDEIYACNYGELIMASYEALVINFGPALKALMGNLTRGTWALKVPPTTK